MSNSSPPTTNISDYRINQRALKLKQVEAILKHSGAERAIYFVDQNETTKTVLELLSPKDARRSAYLLIQFDGCTPTVMTRTKITLKQAEMILKLWPTVKHTLKVNGKIVWDYEPLEVAREELEEFV